MVFKNGENNLVTLADHQSTKALRHEIDGFRGVAGEDNLVFRRRVDEAAHAFARILEGLCRSVGEVMQAAMDVGVFFRHRLIHCVDHRLRLLGGSCVVEIDKRLAINLAGEDGKVGSNAGDIIGHASPVSRHEKQRSADGPYCETHDDERQCKPHKRQEEYDRIQTQ